MIPVCALVGYKIELGLLAKEGSPIGPVKTLQAWVGLHLDFEFDLLTHGHLLEEVLLRGQVQVGTVWKAECTEIWH